MGKVKIRLTVCRYSVTGAFGYVAMAGNQELFQANVLVRPNAPVHIYGNRFLMRSWFDRDTTLCPGYTMRLIQDADGDVAAKLRWDADRNYTLFAGGWEYRILQREDQGLLVFLGEICVMEMSQNRNIGAAERNFAQKLGSDSTVFYMVDYSAAIPLEHVALFTAFPLLKFGC